MVKITRSSDSLSYRGPAIPTKKIKGRIQYPHRLNDTPSLTSLNLKPSKETFKGILHKPTKKLKDVPIKIYKSKKSYKRLQKPVELMKEYSDSIALIAHQRVVVFFQQLALVYNQKHLHFEIGETTEQPETARKRQVFPKIDNTHKAKRNQRKHFEPMSLSLDATHWSTIPSLHAYDKTEWKKDEDAAKGWVYLKGSAAYREWNSGIEMPELFNKSVDQRIDKGKDGLRIKSLEILNSVAQGRTTPEEGVRKFVKQFLHILQKKYEAAEKDKKMEKETSEAIRKGFEIYRQALFNIQAHLDTEPGAFDHHLNLIIAPREVERADIYKIRYKAMQRFFSKQSEIEQAIAKVKRLFSGNKHGTLNRGYDEEAFRQLLVKGARKRDSKLDRKRDGERLRRFFHLPGKEKQNDTRMECIKKSEKKLKNINGKAIKKLSKKISEMMETMRKEELAESRAIMLLLHKMRKWSQADLAEKMNKYKESLCWDESIVESYEKGKKELSASSLYALSAIFEVDHSLFLPVHFNTHYMRMGKTPKGRPIVLIWE